MAAVPIPPPRPHHPSMVRELALLALLAGSAIVAFLLVPDRDLTVTGLALALAPLVVLPWRHTAPVPAFIGVEVAALGARVAFGPNGPTDLMVLVALFAVASRAGVARSAGAVALDVTALTVAAAMVPDGAWPALAGELIGQVVLDVLVVLLALYLAVRREHLVELEDRADRLARLQDLEATAAVDAERRRIARELHDVVAHHVSVMTLHAGAIQRQLGRLQGADDLVGATTELRATGHEAMQELRRMLDLLRTDGADDDRLPQPGLADVEALVGRVREAGLPVTMTTAGDLARPPAGVQAVAYRIVQEALTNTLRHAGAVPVDVAVHVSDTNVRVEVHDHPPPRGLPRHPGDDREAAEAGHGITGMRERAQLYGGHVQAGRHDDGGWRVSADLPSPTLTAEHPRPGTPRSA